VVPKLQSIHYNLRTMKSKAHFKSHPLHPMLIAFPVAFFTGTLVADVLGWVWARAEFHTTALYLTVAGIIMGLVAAIPGIIDFIYVVPPNSSGKKRAAKHGITNALMILVFAAALWYRTQVPSPSLAVIVGLEAAGVVLLSFAGWMGATLVYRNQLGVDIRYANAGKWKEMDGEEKNGMVDIGDVNELQLNQMKLVHVNGKRIVIARSETGLAAFDDHCTHRGGSLAGGTMICGTVQCPWHGSQFNVQTGEVKAGPATQTIKTYLLKQINNRHYLQLSESVQHNQ
jgi:uncharacterized membrane protein/nitrite reductase/ring-hydroxylating ferredoxin subunit